jgi:endonuclease/exonuclease/phosphatase family metal-dependent hydrolase
VKTNFNNDTSYFTQPVSNLSGTLHPLRLLTFNIAHGRGLALYQGFQRKTSLRKNLDRIARLLASSRADLVALQEVDESSYWNRRLHLLEYLQTAADYSWSAMSVHNRRDGRRPLAYGNGFLANYPVNFNLTHAFGQSTIGEKGFQYLEILSPFGTLSLINLHLDYRSRKRRIQQVEQLTVFLQQRSDASPIGKNHIYPPIICGDFNSSNKAAQDAVSHLFRFLGENEHYSLWPKAARTFPSHFPSRGLDFILLPACFQIHICQVIRSFASDHLPVLVEFSPVSPTEFK